MILSTDKSIKFSDSQVLGDPTVRKFGSRDADSWILPRERAAVEVKMCTITIVIDN